MRGAGYKWEKAGANVDETSAVLVHLVPFIVPVFVGSFRPSALDYSCLSFTLDLIWKFVGLVLNASFSLCKEILFPPSCPP